MLQLPNSNVRAADRIDHLVHDLVRRLRPLERTELGCCGVTLAQALVLRVLGARGTAKMSDLAAELGVARSTATRLIAPLARRGLVRRRCVESDGRAVCVELTDEGAELAAYIVACGQRQASSILERIPPERRDGALDGLETFVEAVRRCC